MKLPAAAARAPLLPVPGEQAAAETEAGKPLSSRTQAQSNLGSVCTDNIIPVPSQSPRPHPGFEETGVAHKVEPASDDLVEGSSVP